MSLSNLWISPLIEHCLSSYEENQRNLGLDWENDGSNIRFSSLTQQIARINDLSERNDIPVANLTDSDTQIDAILSRKSLEEYKEDFPTRPLRKDGCRGYTIHLADFELVYEYSTGKPKLHFYVKRFSIIWERGMIKGPPIGKSAGKKPALVTLIKRVFSSIKSQNRPRQRTVDTTGDSNGYSNGYSDIPATQVTNGHTIDSTQPPLMSQLPTRHSTDHDLADPGKLLKQLGKARAPGDKQPSQERSIVTGKLAAVAVPETNRRSASHIPTGTSENSTSDEPQRTELEFESGGPQPNSDKPSPQDLAEEDIIQTNAEPYSPDAQLKAQLEASQHVTLRQPGFAKAASSSIVDPWEGMTGIRAIDVTVPKDQQELLEPDRKPWYPPQVGEPVVSGRVPPALLNEWNKLVIQRHQKEIDNKSESIGNDHLVAPSTPTADTSSDTDSDREWSATPGRTPRRGVLLPVDSSPLKDDSAHPARPRRFSPSDQGGPTEVREEESQHEEGMQAPPINQSPRAESPPIQAEAENNGPSAEASVAEMTPDNDDEHKSDSSSDSEMSVSVPQPLSGSTQQGTSGQVEPGVSSSGPSLPESAGRNIQVMETPATAFNRSRSATYNQDGFGIGPGNMEFQSQADKSSSQSRVLNTYASCDESTKADTSQESSKSLPPSGPDTRNPVLVIGTRSSSEAPATQQTRWSGSSSLWTSSGRKVVEGSMATASLQHSQSSRPFSSYRDLPPSSMLSIEDDNRSSSVHSSVKGSPLKIDRATPMKRFASEMGDSDRGSPSKRNKFDSKPTALELEGGLDERIIFRRQSYIINSAQSVEAARVYEKFRNDYPSYQGKFEHFTKLCSRLQAVRERGSLQRSFLWDDFIIKHLHDYPAYVADCLGNEVKSLNYEEYFLSSFSKPTYKKRSLTVEGTSACAAQCITIDERRSSSRPATNTSTKPSFTESLRDQFSNFHAHSFVETRDLSTDDEQSDDSQNERDTEWSLSQYSIPDSEPARAAAAAQKDSNEDTNLEHISHKPTIAPVTYEHVDSSEDEDEDEDEDMEDVNDTAHETASIELGDNNNSQSQAEAKALEAPQNTAPEIPASDAASNADADIESSHEFPEESINENWFDSLRHIFPTGPVWSDDPNTPFKKWALADQNVLSVRNRRGGASADTDEKGVIRRFPRA
ncbi:hypothetical protein ASPVEDRAFT_316589 [Aspergillus versicolor CBS 583.65]|uniref:Shelterin complex subunit TPP1/Est3 domain-containing protein n=1 Tax=Aspergillus versicolor CBS 583.65 TaxID=1036611 RepID=A0A1L9PXH8_ASPVE|nr:uncharacterized protein ASPVEDRAFT_316589 [Aspergillus versicolor CBS 583.65]OJJ06250.1 hypothetical protein ASPVEDRAFT_316589 [Aspergillus versicolor CBS 583.65]